MTKLITIDGRDYQLIDGNFYLLAWESERSVNNMTRIELEKLDSKIEAYRLGIETVLNAINERLGVVDSDKYYIEMLGDVGVAKK